MVRQEYRQTEVGVIPEDWDIVAIKTLATDMSDGPFGSNLKKEHYTDEKQARIIQLSNIGENGWLDENVKYTTFSHAKTISRCIVQPGNIIITKMMPAGRAIICPNVEEMYVLGSDAIKLQLNATLVNTAYFMYSTKSRFFQTQIKEETQGSTRARTSISKLRKNNVFLPPLPEQELIAEALSDVNSMISSLEKLIAKKKAIKQGTMQKLLTGKKRLPGFTGEWKKYKLGDICCISGRIGFRGYTKNDLVNKGFGAITFSPSDIFEQKLDYSNCDYISFFKYDESPEIQVFNGDIIFCKTASIGKTALIKNLTEKATINPQFVLMNKFKCNNEFLYYIISGKKFVEQILSITGGSTIPTISQEQLKMQLICMPEIEEQTAIASILSDMDNEIEALEQKLAKTRQIKQGMMQQLLTGKIRLV